MRLGRNSDVQLAEVEGKATHRPVRTDNREGHHRLARPAPEVVDVERDPWWEQHQFRGQDRQALPGPLAEESQPDPREDTTRPNSPGRSNERRGAFHVRCLDRVSRQPQRHVRLSGGREISGTAEIGTPGSVLSLARADPPRRRSRLLRGPDAEELAEEKVLGVHRDIGLQFALPPTLRVLFSAQRTGRSLQAVRCGIGDESVRLAGPGVDRVEGDGGHRSRSVTKRAKATRSFLGKEARGTRSSEARASSRCASASSIVSSRAPQSVNTTPARSTSEADISPRSRRPSSEPVPSVPASAMATGKDFL